MSHDGERGEQMKQDPTPNTLRVIDTAVNGLTALFASEMHRVDERFAMFSEYMKTMTNAEAKRLDAAREVDAQAVRVASDRANATAGTLATQVSNFNDAQRALVNATAEAVAKNLLQVSAQINESAKEEQRQQQLKNDAFMASIAALQKAQNENQGRSGISAPLLMMIAGIVGGILVFIVEALMGK